MSPTSQRQYMMEIDALRAELAEVKRERDELKDFIARERHKIATHTCPNCGFSMWVKE